MRVSSGCLEIKRGSNGHGNRAVIWAHPPPPNETLVLFLFRSLLERRKFLHDNMVEIPNRILFSEMKHVTVSSAGRRGQQRRGAENS